MNSYRKELESLLCKHRALQKKHYRSQTENKALRKENLSLKAVIDYLRKERFGSKKKKKQETEEIRIPGKKGAPFGHKGITRKKPEIIDEEIIIPDPVCCPDCASNNIAFIEQEQHTQEDIMTMVRNSLFCNPLRSSKLKSLDFINPSTRAARSGWPCCLFCTRAKIKKLKNFAGN